METTIDDAGRVALPKELQAQLGLIPGMKLNVDAVNGVVTIRPLGNGSPPEIVATDKSHPTGLFWEDNVLVYRGTWHPTVEDINNLIRSLDEERDRKIWNPEL